MSKPNNTRRMQGDEPTPNEVISKQEMLNDVLKRLRARRLEIEEVLPLDVTFENFYSAVNQALRGNPDLLECTPISIVNSCVKAAYDGLRLDGREAALVSHNVNVAAYGQKAKYEKQAQYFPMVFGLVQQILRGGEVLSIEAEVVYEHDEWDITRGTDGKIHHRPNMESDPGEMLFAYTVATLKSGVKTTAYLRKFEILDVMAASKSGVDRDGEPKGVWKRWPRQMWLKTVLRFHRKTLPLGDRQIVDVEQQDLFPDMQRPANPLGLAAGPAPAMPTRRRTQAIEDQSGSGEGSALDFGNQQQGEPVDAGAEDQRQSEQAKAKTAPASEVLIPADDAEWGAWQREVEQDIAACATAREVQTIAAEERERLAAAKKERRDWINGLISDRLTDLVSEAGDGSAPVDGSNEQGQE